MSDFFSLTLGPVAFAGFELPSSITIGGRQRLAIHRLPGGVRIIDALGADPADLAWSGIFTGPDAAIRARALDTLRIVGFSLPLAWDAFVYTVVIERFEADYRSPWWIPYRLSCVVVRDEAAALIADVISSLPAITVDLAAAGSYAAGAVLAVSNTGAILPGTSAYVSATQALGDTVTSIDSQMPSPNRPSKPPTCRPLLRLAAT